VEGAAGLDDPGFAGLGGTDLLGVDAGALADADLGEAAGP
jgi:hypothetical protein